MLLSSAPGAAYHANGCNIAAYLPKLKLLDQCSEVFRFYPRHAKARARGEESAGERVTIFGRGRRFASALSRVRDRAEANRERALKEGGLLG